MELSSARNPLLAAFSASFHQATGLPLQFFTPGRFEVADSPGVPDFCRVMARTRKVCESCTRSHLALQDPQGLEVRSARCFAGLTSSAIPVLQGEKAVGFLHTGHVSVDRPPGCAQPGRGCMLPGRSSRKCGCAGACREMSAMASEKYEGALGIVRLFSKQFASTLIPGASSSPYSTIEHAVQQMRRDVSRDWRLKDLALAAGMHPGYFSEQFHHHTGHTLTDFLATLRVDKARRLLEFTTLPVSEVAFSSGFRSISQFNRVFRARTGHAPMDFRKGRCPHGTGT